MSDVCAERVCKRESTDEVALRARSLPADPLLTNVPGGGYL